MKNFQLTNATVKMLMVTCLVTVSGSSLAHQHEQQLALYDEQNSQIAYGKVIKVKPIYHEVKVTTPVKECWQEPVTRSKHVRHGANTAGSTLAGGLIGGVIGHQFGKGRGKKLSTAVGTLIGAQIGHDSARGSHSSQHSYTAYEKHCEVEHQVSYEEVIDSYRVTYRYKGNKYKVNMPYDPGKRIKLKVSIEPVF